MGWRGRASDADLLAINLRSSTRGRQRWDVRFIAGRRDMAQRLELELLSQHGILKAQANHVTGRVLIVFDPEARELDVEYSLRTILAALDSSPATESTEAERPKSLVRLVSSCLPDKSELAGPPLISLVGHAVHILQGQAFVATVNTGRGEGPAFLKKLGILKPRSRLLAMSALSLLLTGADLLLQYYRKKAWRGLAVKVRHNMRTQLVAKVQSQDLEFYDQYGTGRLIGLVTEETDRISSFIAQAGDEVIEKSATIVVAGAVLFRTSRLLAIVGGLPLPFGALMSRLFEQRVGSRYGSYAEAKGRFSQMLENNLPGIATIKSFTAEELETNRLSDCDQDIADAELEADSASTLLSVLSQGGFLAGMSVATGYGGRLVSTGKISQAEYVRATYWFPQMVMAFMGVERLGASYRAAKSSAISVLDVLDAEPQIRSGPLSATAAVRGAVVFDNVTFGYDPAMPVLRNLSFRIEPGQTLAIVGPTGSGKSTLLRLLLRFYDADAGEISIDGNDIREMTLEGVRGAVSFVSQEVYLFEGTLAENLRLGRPAASDEELLKAMEESGAPDVLAALPGGLNGQIGERGQRLSGGGRQRVAIARALLKGAPILALDEATSQLDYKTEASVKRYLRDRTEGRSTIVVAHRLSTIRDADKIIVLDGGIVRERGTHDELVEMGGLYASIWQLQNGEDDTLSNLEVRIDRPRDR